MEFLLLLFLLNFASPQPVFIEFPVFPLKHKSDPVFPTLLHVPTPSPPLPTPMALHDLKIYSKALQWLSAPNRVWPLVNAVTSFSTSHSSCVCHNFLAVLCTFPVCFYLYFFVLARSLAWNSLNLSTQLTDCYSGVCLVLTALESFPNFFFFFSSLSGL